MAWPEGAGVGGGAVNKMPRYFHRAASSLYIEHKSTARLWGGVGRCSRSSHTDVYAPGAVLRPPPPQSRSLRFLSPCIELELDEFCGVFGYSTSLWFCSFRLAMALVEKSVLVPYSAEQMFNLVDRVEEYPQFLPWCGGASVTELDGTTVHATVHIDYHHIRQSFTTRNVRTLPHHIDITLQDGPFKHLDGAWRFIPLSPSAC